MSRVVDLRADPGADLEPVLVHLRAGGVAAYPTETVYGLGSVCTPEGVAAVRRAKGREPDKPLIALVPSRESVGELTWSGVALELAEIFWPGALTLVLPDPRGIFPAGVRDERSGAVGVRVSPHPVAARLVQEMAVPITSTSLNEPGDPPASSGSEARAILRRLDAGDAWLLDAGTLPRSAPSTVVDCTGPTPVILREGAIPLGRLRCAIPEIGANHA